MKFKLVSLTLLLFLISCKTNSEAHSDSVEVSSSGDIIFNHDLEGSTAVVNDLFRKGMQEIQNQNYKEGKIYFIKANKIEPLNMAILNCLANIESKLGNNPKAEEIYLECIKIDSSYEQTYVNLSKLYLSEANFYQSKQTLLLAANLIENSSQETKFGYYANLVLTYIGLKDYGEALHFNEICKNYTFSSETELFTEMADIEIKSHLKSQ